MGRAGRNVVIDKLPDIIKTRNIDFVIANGENAAGGYGITQAICEELFAVGVDVITTGNHIWDQKETIDFIAKEKDCYVRGIMEKEPQEMDLKFTKIIIVKLE